MKHRIQFFVNIKKINANIFLNYFESIKNKIYKPDYYTPVYIKRYVDLYDKDYDFEKIDNNILFTISPDTEEQNFNFIDEEIKFLKIDVSFSNIEDFNETFNFIKQNKNLCEKIIMNQCFECRHDEIPLKKDGQYFFIE